jgi:hypothetical protein
MMLKLTEQEVVVIKNAINRTLMEFIPAELQTRIGYYKDEVMPLYENIKADQNASEVDLKIITQILNETWHGYDIDDFKSVIGEERSFAKDLLLRIQHLLYGENFSHNEDNDALNYFNGLN